MTSDRRPDADDARKGDDCSVTDHGDGVIIRLSRDEALVLFEWLHRCENEGRFTAPDHHAEQVALWNLSALLERELVEPLRPDYARLVADAL